MLKNLLFILYFFTFSLYVNFQQGTILVSVSLLVSFICFVLLFFRTIIQFDKVLISKNEFVLFILMGIYLIYTSVIGYIYGMQNMAVLKVLNNDIFILIFMALLLFHRQYKRLFVSIRNMVCYSAIFVGLIGIILFLKDISVIRFSLHFPFVFLLDQASFNNTVGNIGEYRYQYTFTHKIRFGYFCLVMIFLFFKNEYLSKRVKVLGISLMFINIMIGNTATSFISSAILVAYFIKNVKLNKYLIVLRNMFVFISFVGLMIAAYIYISKERNILTLGFRLPIWEGVIEEIKKSPFGYVDSYSFHNFTYFKVPYVIGSAHNVFLQEAMDYGVIGGIIFAIIYIQYFYSLKTNRMVIFLATTVIFMADAVLAKEGFALFLFTYFLLDIEKGELPEKRTIFRLDFKKAAIVKKNLYAK